MWWLFSIIMPMVAAWFVTKLMNQGDFDANESENQKNHRVA